MYCYAEHGDSTVTLSMATVSAPRATSMTVTEEQSSLSATASRRGSLAETAALLSTGASSWMPSTWVPGGEHGDGELAYVMCCRMDRMLKTRVAR